MSIIYIYHVSAWKDHPGLSQIDLVLGVIKPFEKRGQLASVKRLGTVEAYLSVRVLINLGRSGRCSMK